MKYFFSIILGFYSIVSFSQNKDRDFESKIKEAISGYHGDVGIYIKDLKSGKELRINADSVFPTASIVKVSILIGVIDKIRRGELNYDSAIVYRDSLLYEGEDILGSFKDGEKILLKKVMMLMLTTSDNTASLWLQQLAGNGTRINSLLDSLGFQNTRINSRTPGREKIREIYGWGQTSPAEMGKIFEMIYRNQIFGSNYCDRMMRVLGRNFWDENEAISQIPPTIEVFSKNGCVDASRSEILLVNAPNRPYILGIFTKNNSDTTWARSNEGWTLARSISRIAWQHFEPKIKWTAPQP